MDYIDLGKVNNITTNIPTFDVCTSTIMVEFVPDRPETWINLKKNIHDILDDPDGYVLCSVNDIVKANDELLKLKELEKDRDMWKRKYGSVITDTFRILSANHFGVKFDFDGFDERGNWLITMDFPELDDAKKRISGLEKALDAAVKNAKFWHDREKEVEEQLENLKKENQALKVKNGDLYNERGALQAKLVKRNAELECVKSENSELKKELEDLKSKKVATCTLESGADGRLKFIYTYMDGHNEPVCTVDGADAESLARGTIPKCSSCAYNVSGSRLADVWCHKPTSKEGPGTVRRLSTEEAEGPACVDFKAKE